jgi:putative copper resistance protein D
VPNLEAQRKQPIPADEKSVAKGKAIYAKNCAECHGPVGKGDGLKGRDLEPKPGDLSSPGVAAESDGALH